MEELNLYADLRLSGGQEIPYLPACCSRDRNYLSAERDTGQQWKLRDLPSCDEPSFR